MENDILDSLEDLGYSGPLLKDDALQESIKQGPKSPEFTKLVEWLTKELQVLLQLEETVNSITDPDDYSSFLVELNAFLKEMGCPHRSLTEGATKDKLQTSESLYTLLDYLCSELQAARMLEHRKTADTKMKVEMKESTTAGALREMLIALGISKPPATVTPKDLFAKVESKVQEILQQHKDGAVAVVGRPLFSGILNHKQWDSLSALQQQMHKEYSIRRDLLLKRLDVTIQSFKWGDRLKFKTDAIVSAYDPKRKEMKGEPCVLVASVLAAREDLAIIEKTSSVRVLKNTQCDVKKVMIGRVPDRGGRPNEQRPPPPEMPSWQKRTEGPSQGSFRGRGRGGGGGFDGERGGGRGGESDRGGRGGRVQGNWSNQQSNNASYDGGWDKGQTNQQAFQQPNSKHQYHQANYHQQQQQNYQQPQYQQPQYQQPYYQQHYQQPHLYQQLSSQEQAMQSTYNSQVSSEGRGHRGRGGGGRGGQRGGRGGYDAQGSYGNSQRGNYY